MVTEINGREEESCPLLITGLISTIHIIFQMLDLILFIVILVILVLAFGTLSVAILNPRTPLDSNLLKEVIRRPYFQIYGSLHLEDFESGTTFTVVLLGFMEAKKLLQRAGFLS